MTTSPYLYRLKDPEYQIKFRDQSMNLYEWAEHIRLSSSLLLKRFKNGVAVRGSISYRLGDILSTPEYDVLQDISTETVLTHCGRSMSVLEWAHELDLIHTTVMSRVREYRNGRRGWDDIFIPSKKRLVDCQFCENGRHLIRYSRCPECSQKNTRRIKHILLHYLSDGKCQKCGYNKCIASLHFHHRDPLTKSFNISSRCTEFTPELITEADKCDVLCANCHGELHYNGVVGPA